MKKINGIIFIILFFVLVILGYKILSVQNNSVAGLARKILQTCNDTRSKSICYEKEIPKLMEFPTRLSIEDAFTLATFVKNKDPLYTSCHILGHKISAIETKKNPRMWSDAFARCPIDCEYGCQHGVLTAAHNKETFTDSEINRISEEIIYSCQSHPGVCFHALGHVYMLVTSGDHKASEALCGTISKDDSNIMRMCNEGIFMTVYQPIDPEIAVYVRLLAPPTKEKVDGFCRVFTQEAYHACHRESWPLFRDDIHTKKGAAAFCSYTHDVQYQQVCLTKLLSIPSVVQSGSL